MRIRRADNFHMTFSAVVTGLFFGSAFISLVLFLSTLPYGAYVANVVYVFLAALFLVLLLLGSLILAVRSRRQQYAALLFSGVFSIMFSCIGALIFTFAYPYVHQALYIELLEFTGFLVNAKRFSMAPAPGHYWISLSSALPGLITGAILLFVYYGRKRKKEAEYHQPRKKNYYYI